jgi:hypothetical protein
MLNALAVLGFKVHGSTVRKKEYQKYESCPAATTVEP